MNNYILKFAFGISILLLLNSCNEFKRTEVVPEIYVDKSSFTGFIGDELQLTASPTNVNHHFEWSSEDSKVATVTSDGKVKLIGEGFTKIVVNAGNLQRKVEINALTKIPLVDVVLSDQRLDLTPNASKTITVKRIPENANNLTTAIWTSENNNIATVNEIGQIVGMAEGETYINYTLGTITKKVKVSVSFTRPFNGPHELKAGVEKFINAADFDFGGLNRAFFDNGTGAAGSDSYRRGKGDTQSIAVTIEGNGTNIGYLSAGKWYQYTVDVKDAGIYLFEASLSGNAVGKYHIEVDGVNVTGNVDVPSNGSWNSWVFNPNPPKQINLAQGARKVRFVIDQAGFNFRGLRFRKM